MSKVLAQHWPHFGFVVVGVFAFLSLRTPPSLRAHVRGAAWLLPWLYGIYLLSYVGEFGPQTSPLVGTPVAFPSAHVLAFPWGTLAAVALSAVALVEVARSGFRTPELESWLANAPPP